MGGSSILLVFLHRFGQRLVIVVHRMMHLVRVFLKKPCGFTGNAGRTECSVVVDVFVVQTIVDGQKATS